MKDEGRRGCEDEEEENGEWRMVNWEWVKEEENGYQKLLNY